MPQIDFSQIHARAFAHPADRRATRAFERLPLFPDLMSKISQLKVERRFRAHHMYNSVLLGRCQLRSLYGIVHKVADRLGVPPPTTYVARHGEANAFVFGRHDPTIVLTSELVDMMSDQELEGIIAHEMGHILCQHMLYMDVGLALSSGAVPILAKVLPIVEETVAGLFFAWFRAAEYSADRAALLILGAPGPLADSLTRLAGVPRRFESEFDLELFVQQVADHDEQASLWDKFVTLGVGMFLTHPEPAKRVGALLEWERSNDYKAICQGRYLTKFLAKAEDRIVIEGVPSCPLCRTTVGQAPFCPNPECGLVQDPREHRLCPNGHVVGIDWGFCIACGAGLRPDAIHNEIPCR